MGSVLNGRTRWELVSYHYVLDGLGKRTQTAERVLPPAPVQHLSLVMRD